MNTEAAASIRERASAFQARQTNGACTGFTLLEVMVSLSIIAIALLAIYGNFSHTLALNIEQKFNAVAPLLAARVLADFESRSADEMVDESGAFGVEFAGFVWKVTVESLPSETLGEISKDLHSIDVVVSFNGDERIFQCKTIRFLRRESEE